MFIFNQHTFILFFILLTSASCTYINPAAKHLNHPRLRLQNDSGYVTKQEVLPFLLEAGLTDTSEWWAQTNDRDTLGKYYKSDKNGDYFMVTTGWRTVEKSNVQSRILIELSKDGFLVGKDELYSNFLIFDRGENYYNDFKKAGNFFIISAFFPGGGGYSARWMVVFDSLNKTDNNSAIFTNSISMHGGSQYNPQAINSTFEIVGNECIVHYFIKEGMDDEKSNDILWDKPIERIIKYKNDGQSWEAEDSSLLKGMDIYY